MSKNRSPLPQMMADVWNLKKTVGHAYSTWFILRSMRTRRLRWLNLSFLLALLRFAIAIYLQSLYHIFIIWILRKVYVSYYNRASTEIANIQDQITP